MFVITRISFVKSKFVISRFCSIHFIVILAGLKKIVRYAEDWLNSFDAGVYAWLR